MKVVGFFSPPLIVMIYQMVLAADLKSVGGVTRRGSIPPSRVIFVPQKVVRFCVNRSTQHPCAFNVLKTASHNPWNLLHHPLPTTGTIFRQKASTSAGGPTKIANAKIALIQFQLSAPKTDMEMQVWARWCRPHTRALGQSFQPRGVGNKEGFIFCRRSALCTMFCVHKQLFCV